MQSSGLGRHRKLFHLTGIHSRAKVNVLYSGVKIYQNKTTITQQTSDMLRKIGNNLGRNKSPIIVTQNRGKHVTGCCNHKTTIRWSVVSQVQANVIVNNNIVLRLLHKLRKSNAVINKTMHVDRQSTVMWHAVSQIRKKHYCNNDIWRTNQI